MTDVLIERGNLDSDIYAERTPCKDWSDVLIAQELPEAGRDLEQVLSWCLQGKHGPADTLILHFQPTD